MPKPAQNTPKSKPPKLPPRVFVPKISYKFELPKPDYEDENLYSTGQKAKGVGKLGIYDPYILYYYTPVRQAIAF